VTVDDDDADVDKYLFCVCCTGDYIDVIHRDWYLDYDRLESHHGYIQW